MEADHFLKIQVTLKIKVRRELSRTTYPTLHPAVSVIVLSVPLPPLAQSEIPLHP